MADKLTDKKGPGLEGQMSGEGRLRTADAAVSQDKQPYEAAGEGGSGTSGRSTKGRRGCW